MQNVFLSLIINLLMAGLLMATMIYCRRLNARVKILQDSKSDLARIVKEFDESTQRATDSIAEIHKATQRLSDNMQHKIDKANFLADDLQYMIEKGQKLSGKTDVTATRMTRAEPAAAPAPASRASAAATPAAAPTSAFILPDEAPATPRRSAALGDLGASNPLGGGAGGTERMRSRAEQEIMSALSTKRNTGE